MSREVLPALGARTTRVVIAPSAVAGDFATVVPADQVDPASLFQCMPGTDPFERCAQPAR